VINKYEIWIADLSPRFGTEPGKIRPVVIVQTDLLNGKHLSTIVCPVTTRIIPGATLLRIHLQKGEAGMEHPSDILIDQLRAIDNGRLIRKIGVLNEEKRLKINENLSIILDL